MTRILVGGDGSANGAQALRWAALLAPALDADVEVLRAWSYPAATALPGGPQPPGDAQAMDERTAVELDAWVAEVLGDDGPEVSTRVERGSPGAALARRGADEAPILTVVGTRGLGDVSRVILGSTSRRTLELSTGPLAVVPPGSPTPEPGRPIVVGVDGSAASALALDHAATLAAAVGCEVVAVHATEMAHPELRPDLAGPSEAGPDAPVDDWVAPLRAAGVPHRTRLADGDPRIALPAIAADVGAWAIVVGRRGIGPLTRVLVGSVTNHLVAHTDHAVVVVPPPGPPDPN